MSVTCRPRPPAISIRRAMWWCRTALSAVAAKAAVPHGAARSAALGADRRGSADGRLHPARRPRSVLLESADRPRPQAPGAPYLFLSDSLFENRSRFLPMHRSEILFRSRCRLVLITTAVAAGVRGVADEMREFVRGTAADAPADRRDQLRSRKIGRCIDLGPGGEVKKLTSPAPPNPLTNVWPAIHVLRCMASLTSSWTTRTR